MLVIRLHRTGKKHQPFFKIVVTDKRRAASSGLFVEELGFTNPITKERKVNKERVLYWISQGAQPSDTVHNILVSEKILEGKKVAVHNIKKLTEEEKAELAKKEEEAKAPKEEKKEEPKEEIVEEKKEEPKEEPKEEKKEEIKEEVKEEPKEEKKEEVVEEKKEEEKKEETPKEEPKEEEKKEA